MMLEMWWNEAWRTLLGTLVIGIVWAWVPTDD